ncbi:cell division protein FtsQ/DivIB [Streptomyces sp. H27-D2]|uniref:cell division protein FtsQ/DivIB n=1 Tax=Streptomyces sp. H27-D2 TaxID=3046304 RepID=UPI002DB64530|nr:FtsQ-type POTRA domain-containing protein [Streptomyces sp. H27-D2]MEC4017949.1 FtsQ-type POTRA domain-containing protein [Streptomyces sp. H27-D2]
MAGPTTAQRGERQASPSGPRPPREPGRGLRMPRRRTLLICAIVALLVGAGALWALYGSNWLRVERVRTSGTTVLTPREVTKAAAVPIGAPLATVDAGAVRARLLEKLPRIAAVEVVRSWPHSVALKVSERTPVTLIEKGGKFTEVDAEGVRFARVATAPKGVPLLEMDVRESPSLRRFGEGRLRREAARVAADLPEAVHRDTRVVRVRSYDSIRLELTGGRTVVWGSGEYGRVKSKVLTALMRAEHDAGKFDVSAPSAPAAAAS